MAFTTPYVTNKYTAYAGDIRSINLSFAVWLIDDYTKGKPIGRIQVGIKETGKKTIENLSGYYCFTGLLGENYTVSIRSDLYFPEEIIVDMSAFSDPNNRVVEINGEPEVALKPSPVYPFPENATLLRGVVRDAINVDEPIRNAKVKVMEYGLETTTDENGNFVLYLSEIENEKEVNIEIQKYEYTKNVDVVVEESKAKSMGIITFPT